MSMSGSGAALCPATPARSSRSPAPACSASSAFSVHPASRSSITSAKRICVKPCRSSPLAGCRCWCTLSGRPCCANRSRADPRSYATWLDSRPPTAEQAAIDLLIELSAQTSARVHIVHLASADALASIGGARAAGVPITVETCPHYLTFAAEDVADGDTAMKCAPPIREGEHRERLWRALAEGHIDLVATDHSPAPAALKHIEDGNFIEAWGGIASLQISLPIVWTGAAARGIAIERIAHWMSAAPARLAGLDAHKGAIKPGSMPTWWCSIRSRDDRRRVTPVSSPCGDAI